MRARVVAQLFYKQKYERVVSQFFGSVFCYKGNYPLNSESKTKNDLLRAQKHFTINKGNYYQ